MLLPLHVALEPADEPSDLVDELRRRPRAAPRILEERRDDGSLLAVLVVEVRRDGKPVDPNSELSGLKLFR